MATFILSVTMLPSITHKRNLIYETGQVHNRVF